MLHVSASIRLKLFLPKACSGFRRGSALTAMMSVPEAAMNEDHFSASGKDQIWAPGKTADVEAVPVAESVNQASYSVLGLGVLAADRLHDGATLLDCELVRHTERLIFLSNAACLPE